MLVKGATDVIASNDAMPRASTMLPTKVDGILSQYLWLLKYLQWHHSGDIVSDEAIHVSQEASMECIQLPRNVTPVFNHSPTTCLSTCRQGALKTTLYIKINKAGYVCQYFQYKLAQSPRNIMGNTSDLHEGCKIWHDKVYFMPWKCVGIMAFFLDKTFETCLETVFMGPEII